MTTTLTTSPAQLALDTATFVIVDLETCGEDPTRDAITEIGAVRYRASSIVDEMSTMVDPQQPIPPEIVKLTGITQDMVTGAVTISDALPAFLEFAHGAVLVAHNAEFDLGFLTAAAAAHRITWPTLTSICTVRLARKLFSRDEAPTVALRALAELLGATNLPTHRALDDARATAEVLHELIDRARAHGITTPGELSDFAQLADAA
ncbi:exonuclease domain-containing protein [Mycobacterium sp. NPDC003449]